MDTHIVAGVVITITVLSASALFFERDWRLRWERARQRKRLRERAKEKDLR
jgi:hypothetical protein